MPKARGRGRMPPRSRSPKVARPRAPSRGRDRARPRRERPGASRRPKVVRTDPPVCVVASHHPFSPCHQGYSTNAHPDAVRSHLDGTHHAEQTAVVQVGERGIQPDSPAAGQRSGGAHRGGATRGARRVPRRGRDAEEGRRAAGADAMMTRCRRQRARAPAGRRHWRERERRGRDRRRETQEPDASTGQLSSS